MIEFKTLKGRITRELSGNYEITFIVPIEEQGIVEPLNALLTDDKVKMVQIDHYKKKRSLDANAYCFMLCQKIAEVIGNTKENVYKQAIKQVGQFEILPIRNDAVERWIEAWETKGLGWQSEIMGASKLDGYTNTINYYGSSVYSGFEMGVLIDEIINRAKELSIQTMTPNEINSLKTAWEERRIKN